MIIVEGNYLLLNQDPWDKIKGLMDKSIFISIDEDEAKERLIHRHMAAWGWNREKAEHRVVDNDLPNLRLVVENGSERADMSIKSVQEQDS